MRDLDEYNACQANLQNRLEDLSFYHFGEENTLQAIMIKDTSNNVFTLKNSITHNPLKK